MRVQLLIVGAAVAALMAAEATAQQRWLRMVQRIDNAVDAGGDLAGRQVDAQGLTADALLWHGERRAISLVLRLEYDYVEYDVPRLSGANLDAHDLRLPLALRGAVGRDSFALQFAPGFATSSNVINRLEVGVNDLVLDLAAAWFWSRGETFSWVTGAAVDRRFGSTRAYPLLGLDYRPGQDWRFTLVLPEPVVVHSPHERWWWGLRIAPTGNRWRMLDSLRGRRYRLREQGWTVALQGAAALRERLWLVAGVAHRGDRELRLRDGSDRRLRAHPHAGWSVSFGFALGALPPRLQGERW